MADIGIRVESDSLVLWKGRDFKWHFENLDLKEEPIPFPAGRLFFELQTGGQHNARQRVTVKRATGGSYRLGVLGEFSAPIDFDDVSQNPQGLPGDITEALEGISTVGAGNVSVSPLMLYPYWVLNFNLNSNRPLTEQLVNVINKTANDFFNTFDQLLGVNIEMTVHDNLNFTLFVTSLKAFDEVGLLTFAVNVTSTAVRNFFNAVSGLLNAINTVNVDFYWHRSFEVTFHGALGNQPMPAIAVDTAGLTGSNPQVSVDVLDPGRTGVTVWDMEIDGSLASIKVESEDADQIPERTKWQLVFLPAGEEAGGDPIARGTVTRLG